VADEPTYKIVRKYFRSDTYPAEILDTGLTLEEAQEHCSDPETSSRTCTTPNGVLRTERCGPWFECFYKEEDDDE